MLQYTLLFGLSFAFERIAEKLSFEKANAKCKEKYGTELASIHSYSDFESAVNICGALGPCWLGGVHGDIHPDGSYTLDPDFVNGNWQWIDGESWNYDNWGVFSNVPQGQGITGEYFTCIWSIWHNDHQPGVHDCGDGSSYPLCNSPKISCDESIYGAIDFGEIQEISFLNDKQQSVTFTNCESDFDTKMYLYASDGSTLLQSSTYCDGDDCVDEEHYNCAANLQETFTFSSLPTGTYVIKISAANSGGKYRLQTFCDLRGKVEGQNIIAGVTQTEVLYSLQVETPVHEVTFTNCGSSFDTKLVVYNSNFEVISYPYCDGDDCTDPIHHECSTSLRETFTIPTLLAGNYFVGLQPFSNGGSYQLQVLHTDIIGYYNGASIFRTHTDAIRCVFDSVFNRPDAYGEYYSPQDGSTYGTGYLDFSDDRKYTIFYYPVENTIYWDQPKESSTNYWVKAVEHHAISHRGAETLAIGGIPVNWNDYTFVATLVDSKGNERCTASIISTTKGTLLTAAHCFCKGDANSCSIGASGSITKAIIGCNDIGKPRSCNTDYKEYAIDYYYVHQGYKKDYSESYWVFWKKHYFAVDDVAIVFLKEAITQPSNAKNAVLLEKWWEVDENPSLYDLTGKESKILGYGIQSVPDNGKEELIEAHSRIVKCKNGFGDKQICSKSSDVTTCPGDSGGPGLLKDTNEVFGVLSSGATQDGHCFKGGENKYTEVREYRDWIDTCANKQSQCTKNVYHL